MLSFTRSTLLLPLKPALIFAAVASHAAETVPAEYYVDPNVARHLTYEKDPDTVVQIFGSIDGTMAKETIKSLYEISNMNSDTPIVVEISSGGGEVYAGFAILDVINTIPNPVTTVCMGSAASMAAIINIGNKGENYATENCRLMLHEPSSGVTGTASAIEQTADNIKTTTELFVEIIADAAGLPESYAKDLVSTGNTFMTAQQAVGLNLLDGIIPSGKTHPAPKRELRILSDFCNETRERMSICREKTIASADTTSQIAEQRDPAGPAVQSP